MIKNQVRINWEYAGNTDYSFGTGAYASEKRLGWISAVIIPCFLVYLLLTDKIDWNIAQIAVAMLLAFDISGGLVCNALNSCKRFYHSPPKLTEGKLGHIMKHPFLFTVFHVHPFIAGLAFDNWNWTYGIVWYSLLLGAVALVLRMPLYLQRPVSMLLIMCSVMANFYLIQPVAGFEWLMPLLFVKIVYGHAVREEPYRK